MFSVSILSDLLYLIFSNFQRQSDSGISFWAKLIYALNPLNLPIDLFNDFGWISCIRGLRALRLLRLLRLLSKNKIFKYSNPLHGIIEVIEKNALLYRFAFSIVGGATVVGGLSIYLIERNVNENINRLSDGLVGIGHTNHRWIRRHFTDNRTGKTHRWNVDDFGNVYRRSFRRCCWSYNASIPS